MSSQPHAAYGAVPPELKVAGGLELGEEGTRRGRLSVEQRFKPAGHGTESLENIEYKMALCRLGGGINLYWSRPLFALNRLLPRDVPRSS